MIDWSLYEFRGIVPRLQGRQLPKTYATVAHNVDLTHGTLKPFRDTKKISDKSGGVRLHSYDCELLVFNKCVSIAEWIPDCPRLFITGRNGYPETAEVVNGGLVYRRLGVPRPPAPPNISNHVVNTDTSRSVAYVTTFVNNFGDEGPPSLPSQDVSIDDGQSVAVTFYYNTDLEYDIKRIRIYRRESGFRTGSEKESTPNTNWYLVGEVPISSGSLIDDMTIEAVGYPLSTAEFREPPQNLTNITLATETAVLVGSLANKILFSKNLQSHNWPLSQEMTLDDNIVALESYGDSIYVATDGYPYRIDATTACDDRSCRSVIKYDVPMPMIACHTGRGSVATPLGMIYVSADGLVLLSGSGIPKVISTDHFSADDWRKLEPHTMRLAYHKGALFVVSDAISFILWLDRETYADATHKNLVTISDEPVDMVQTRQGELLFLNEDGIYHWAAAESYRSYTWVSEPIQSGFLLALTRLRAKVLNSQVKVTLESAWGEVSRWHSPQSGTIPYTRMGRHHEHFIRAEGTGELTELVAGVSSFDMGTK